jgi:hypothetical protein
MAYRQVYSWLGGAIATTVILCPIAQATALAGWSFDETTHQLEFSLPETIIPQFFMLAEPARIVLDIPNTQVGNVATDQTYTGTVERIRVSQYDAATVRIVMDLAPGTVLDPQQADIQFDDVNGQRQWRFRPLISGVAIAVAPTTAPVISQSPDQIDVGSAALNSQDGETAAAPETTAVTPSESAPRDTELAPATEDDVYSFSAASLQSAAPLVSATRRELPIEVYEPTPTNTSLVTVPPVAAAPTVNVPALEPSADLTAGAANPSVAVPPMTAPDLAVEPTSVVSVPTISPTPVPAPAADVSEEYLPVLDPLPTAVPTPQDGLIEGGDSSVPTAQVAIVPEPSRAVEPTTEPSFVDPDAGPDGSSDITPVAAITTPIPDSPSVAAMPAAAPGPESASATLNPGQRVAEAAVNTPAQTPVIQLPAQSRTITQTRWPEPIQFGQPLPD